LLDWLGSLETPEKIPADVFKDAIIKFSGITAEPQYALKFHARYTRYNYTRDIELDSIMFKLRRQYKPAIESETLTEQFEELWGGELGLFEEFISTTKQMYLEELSSLES
jgi:hypothetical protein